MVGGRGGDELGVSDREESSGSRVAPTIGGRLRIDADISRLRAQERVFLQLRWKRFDY